MSPANLLFDLFPVTCHAKLRSWQMVLRPVILKRLTLGQGRQALPNSEPWSPCSSKQDSLLYRKLLTCLKCVFQWTVRVDNVDSCWIVLNRVESYSLPVKRRDAVPSNEPNVSGLAACSATLLQRPEPPGASFNVEKRPRGLMAKGGSQNVSRSVKECPRWLFHLVTSKIDYLILRYSECIHAYPSFSTLNARIWWLCPSRTAIFEQMCPLVSYGNQPEGFLIVCNLLCGSAWPTKMVLRRPPVAVGNWDVRQVPASCSPLHADRNCRGLQLV